MTCKHCGLSSTAVSDFCTHCGTRREVERVSAPAYPTATGYAGAAATTTGARMTSAVERTLYPEFLMRFFAYLIDWAIAGGLALVAYLLMAIIGGVFALGSMHAARGMHRGFGAGMGLGVSALFFILDLLLVISVYAGYFVLLETSPRQATVGKSLLGMRVTTLDGKTISVLQSLGRLLIKDTFSFVLMIGYFMAAFTERKQALHDFAAGTLVVKIESANNI